MPGTFIDVTVDPSIASDAELARKLSEVCPVDIFAVGEGGAVSDRRGQPRRVRALPAVHQRGARRDDHRAQAVLGRDASRLSVIPRPGAGRILLRRAGSR